MKLKEIAAGEVYAFHSDRIKPPKKKFHLCIGPNQFFLINTKPSLHNASIPIRKIDYAFLSHDSHINCGHVFQYNGEFTVTEAKRTDLTIETLQAIIRKIPDIRTLTPIQKDAILKALQQRAFDFPIS